MKRAELSIGLEVLTQSGKYGSQYLAKVLDTERWRKPNRFRTVERGLKIVAMSPGESGSGMVHIMRTGTWNVTPKTLDTAPWEEDWVPLNQVQICYQGHIQWLIDKEDSKRDQKQREEQVLAEYQLQVGRLRRYASDLGVDLGYIGSTPGVNNSISFSKVIALMDAAKEQWFEDHDD